MGWQEIRLWDVETGTEKHTLTGDVGFIESLLFSPDGKTFAGVGRNEIRLWAVETGTEKHTLTGDTGFTITVSSDGKTLVSFSPDGKTFAGVGRNEIRLWAVETGTEKHTLTRRGGNAYSISFSHDGKTLAGGSSRGIRLWDVETGTEKHTFKWYTEIGYMSEFYSVSDVHSISFSPEGGTLATASRTEIRLWDIETGEEKHTIRGHTKRSFGVAFSPDGKTLVSGRRAEPVRVWDVETGAEKPVHTAHTRDLFSVLSPNGKTLAGTNGDKIYLWEWDGETRKEKHIFIGHTGPVSSVAFSPDGKTLASGGRDNTIRFWDVETKAEKHTLTGHTGEVNSVAFSPDGNTLASAGGWSDDTVRLWDVETKAEKHTLTGHTGSVNSVAFSPDGKTLASGGRDNTIRFWDVETKAEKHTLTGHTGEVNSVAFSPDGNTLASGSTDSTVLLWSLAPVPPEPEKDDSAVNVLLSIPAGISLIHVPLKVAAIDEVAQTITSIADLYDALGGEASVNYLITYDSQTSDWLSYFGPSDKGTVADKGLTDDTGIIAGMKAPVSLYLSGDPLGTNGSSNITLTPGLNLVGLPLKDSRINRVSDLFALDGIGGNVSVVIVSDNGAFKAVGQPGDDGDIPVTGGQSFIMTPQRAATVTISGEGWTKASETAAAPPIGIQVTDTTPVLALRGAIFDEGGIKHRDGFRVTVKNLSNGQAVTGMTRDDDGVVYQLAVVDIEKGQAAMIGDNLEISAQSSDSLIGVGLLQYTVTAEDVKQSWIQLPALVVYKIPAETELLPNYPNPFNPETWIPYRLAEDAFVTLTIYDASGQVVRTIEVGHRVAAFYEGRSKAIYWNGKNEFGEQTASGVYFYHLSAGRSRLSVPHRIDYSATRKMLILK